jgi:hypothetical protein
MKPIPRPTQAQLLARESFDLDEVMARLPPAGPSWTRTAGQAGLRLRGHLVADISDDLLREVAREALGAMRCSEKYLDALRVVLGNQADAERHGYRLELNVRVSFASEKVMRTILDQMRTAGLTVGVTVGLGAGRCQTVQCFDRHELSNRTSAPYCGHRQAGLVLCALDRMAEGETEARREALPAAQPIAELEDIPF